MRGRRWVGCLLAVALLGCSSDDTATADAGNQDAADGRAGDGDADGDSTISDVVTQADTSYTDTTLGDAFEDVIDESGDGADDQPADGAASSDASDGGDGGTLVCPVSCPAGMKYCYETCVAIDDPQYGCSATSCIGCPGYGSGSGPALASVASTTCSNGACAVARCATGFADCDGNFSNGCESDLSSPQTCGSCTNKCGTSQVCDGNQCASACTFPKTNCNGACHDLTSDPAACGSCAKRCPELNGTATCTNATCGLTCDSGFSTCGSTDGCAYQLNDDAPGQYCGNCSTVCPTPTYGQTVSCVASMCTTACAPGFSSCNGQCVDENSDPANCGGCAMTCSTGQICLNGGCTLGSSGQVIPGLSAPEDIVVDATNIYWTDTGSNEVWQADKSTFATTKIASNQAKPYRIAVDSQYVYWTSNLGGAILYAPIGSSSFSVLYSANQPTAIAVDDTYVYWADSSGNIYKGAKSTDAGAPTTLAASSSCGVYGCKADAFVADATNLYGLASQTGGLYAVNKTTGTVTTYVASLVQGSLHGYAVDTANIYYVDLHLSNNWLLADDKGTAKGAPDSPKLPVTPFAMVDDGCALYWTDGGASVWKLPTALLGGYNASMSPQKLTVSGQKTNRLTVDDTYVYWTDSGWIGRARK